MFFGGLFVGRVYQFSGAQWEGLGAVELRAFATEFDKWVVSDFNQSSCKELHHHAVREVVVFAVLKAQHVKRAVFVHLSTLFFSNTTQMNTATRLC